MRTLTAGLLVLLAGCTTQTAATSSTSTALPLNVSGTATASAESSGASLYQAYQAKTTPNAGQIMAAKSVTGAFITHLLSDFPSEFHVFLNLQSETDVVVGTQSGQWYIRQGKIT